MRRPGLLLRSPGDPRRAFWIGFGTIAIPVGIALTVKTLGMAGWIGLLPLLAAFVAFAGLVGGALFAVPVLIQGWAWRRIADGTPVAEHDEGLGS